MIPSIVSHIPKSSMEYLGDGVYAAHGRDGVTLWTERENGVHWMVLLADELLTLKRFLFRMGDYVLQDDMPCEDKGASNDEA